MQAFMVTVLFGLLKTGFEIVHSALLMPFVFVITMYIPGY